MFKSLKRVSYLVNDIERDKEWYKKILNSEPVYTSPLIVIFKINNSELVLVPAQSETKKDSRSIDVYWEVDDTDLIFKKLVQYGAAPVREPFTILNSRIAQIADPSGNILGITGDAFANKTNLQERTSDSAMTVTFCRAISAAEIREEIKGPDYLAEIFLNEESKKPLKDPAARDWVLKNILTGGAYEYFIARTAYIDNIFVDLLKENIPQIVLLGAGYDTRTFRFCKYIKDTKIFELDSSPTQQRKIRLLKENKVQIPEALSFIPINFDTDSLSDKLEAAGYSAHKKTFFIWEGVTYYLSNEGVYNTFNFIKNNSPSGSLLFFDYMLYSQERHKRPEIKDALERMKRTYTAEAVRFMVDEGNIASLLNRYGLAIKDEVSTEQMEKRYLTLRDGTLSGRIIDLFSFILAQLK